ncbi:hypothetical protein [Winogradskyella pacifica]|uniref:hypothetical protein n=1 Tax=Winogradskyella pacifica TaxID=664642 RepID=UPI0015CB0E0F|nr:hypothetical protein [Winogradskyella pacifica]
MADKQSARKRMMFIQKEDYNYLCYNLILILNNLGCTKESNEFRDFRKIAYLVDFTSASKKIDDFSQDELGSIYSKAHIKKKLLSHLLIVLKNKDYLGISMNKRHKSFDIWLKTDNLPDDFLSKDMFRHELENIEILKKEIRGLRTTTIKTMVNTLFTSKNILTWEI